VALLAVAILAVGGAGAFVVASGKPRPSKAEFVTKADGICAAAGTVPRPTTYAELKSAAAGVAATTEAEVRRLDDAGRPGLLDRGRAQGVVDALRATATAARSVEAAAASSDDGATVAAAQAMRVSSADAMAKAKAYGATGCAAAAGRSQDALVGGANAVVKAGFIAKANMLCQATVSTIAKLAPPGKDPTDVGRYVNEVMGPLEKLSSALRGLPVPPGDEVTVAELLQGLDQANAVGRTLAGANLAQDLPRVATTTKQFADAVHAAGTKLNAYGFGPCQYNA
jgi:hypothetical protein